MIMLLDTVSHHLLAMTDYHYLLRFNLGRTGMKSMGII